MNKDESLGLYKEGIKAWNIWANDMLAKKAKLEEDGLWKFTYFKIGYDYHQVFDDNQAITDWINESRVDFSDHTFQLQADFSNFIFPSSVSFEGTTFSNKARFYRTTFSDEADFNNATFSGDTLFNSATFSGGAVFNSATFSGGAVFNSATFSGDAVFSSATFSGDAFFESATFSGGAKLDSAKFSSYAEFGNATFSGMTWFNEALFEGYISFHHVIFEGKSSFIAIKAQSFASFKAAKFQFVPDFNQAHFLEAPQFDDSDFSKALNYEQSEDKVNLSSFWRSLKRLAIQGHDHERELLFFAEEIKSQRGIQDKLLPRPLNYWNNKPVWPGGTRYWFGGFYQYFSDFGRSVIWPLLWLLGFGVLFYIFYLNYSIEDKPTPAHNNPITQVTNSCNRSEAAIILSARSALPFIPATSYSEKINRSNECLYGKNSDGKGNMPYWVVIVSIAQTILSTILIFLSLLALRNHSKIK